MYKTKGVIFEYKNIFSKRFGIGFALWILFPLYNLFLLYLDDRLKNATEGIHNIIMSIFILGMILWLPVGVIWAIRFGKTNREIFRYFPKCPQEFRHDVTAEFDFTSKPGNVSCKIKSMYERSGFKTIQGIKYDETHKILVFRWLSYFMESRRLRGKYRHTESAYVVIPAPYSEELVNLLRENHITDIQPFDPELAKYCYQSVNIS